MWSRDPQQIPKNLAGILKIKTSFVITLRCHLTFMLSFFCKAQWNFPETTWCVDSQQAGYRRKCKNQLLSLKPDSDEVCRTVRQHHPPPSVFFVCLEFIVIFIKKIVFVLNWRRKWQATPVSLPGKSHGRRNLAGYSPWDRKSQTWLSNWANTHSC